MKSITFITGNKRKIDDAQKELRQFEISVFSKKLDLDEIQAHNPTDVSIDKAQKAYLALRKPVVVNDAYWSISSLRGFPGAYIKDIVQWFDQEDFMALMKNKKDKTVLIKETVTYFDGRILKSFTSILKGAFIEQPRGNGNSIENIVEFNGYTLSEHHSNGTELYTDNESVWHKFGAWYSSS